MGISYRELIDNSHNEPQRSAEEIIESVKKNLSESAPYESITSIGSTPLPKDLDIFLPSLSRISPCIKQSLKGLLSVNSRD